MKKSIIANNCHGGLISKSYGMPFYSPTVNLQVLPEEFPKFCANLKHYMDAELVEYKELSDAHKTYCEHMFGYTPMEYPMGLVDDVLIVFQHSDDFGTAKDEWDRRKERVDYSQVYYLFHANNIKYMDAVKEFLALDLPHSAVVTENWGIEGAHRFDVPDGLTCFHPYNGKRMIEQNFSVAEWLEV